MVFKIDFLLDHFWNLTEDMLLKRGVTKNKSWFRKKDEIK